MSKSFGDMPKSMRPIGEMTWEEARENIEKYRTAAKDAKEALAAFNFNSIQLDAIYHLVAAEFSWGFWDSIGTVINNRGTVYKFKED